MRQSMRWLGAVAMFLLTWSQAAFAAEPVLVVSAGGEAREFSRSALLAHDRATEITVPKDVAYDTAMTYRAVPVAALLDGLAVPRDRVLEAVALDGFVAQLPSGMLLNRGETAPIAYLAVEPADRPWPPLPGKSVSAGPFYIVWTGPGTVRTEQWPFQLAKLQVQLAPSERWPEIAVAPDLAPDHPLRLGQELFVTQCMVCHTLNGAGNSHVGPDLNRPMSPTEYFQPAALRRLIRDPASVRTWERQQMPGFDEEALSDTEIDLIIGYLDHMAERRADTP